ncbi:pirin family protein [Roseibium suaedae]|uniref:Pirin family protein n=1 Tax=Roseibium suaedae TaxID=735517 RepID=A0A1M7P4Y7_9HYPH|nr:pirin-like bicupin family protein [Roseibium suaedae]SHN11662.1 hypothetical protein SAMN05444272_4112 [Roseibium suaedae]
MSLIHENMNRGHTTTGWLDSFHTFSFGGFRDPARMGYGALRVINEDRIIPGSGFGEHGHGDMDILTLVLAGKLRHQDTLGNETEIAPGEVQLMSAGSGIRHSEMNASKTAPAHFLQIWILPDSQGGAPDYQQASLPEQENARDWTLIASGTRGEAPLSLLSDTKLSIAYPLAGSSLAVPSGKGRRTFVQIVEGVATIGGERLTAGDGLQTSEDTLPPLIWVTDGQALLFDME